MRIFRLLNTRDWQHVCFVVVVEAHRSGKSRQSSGSAAAYTATIARSWPLQPGGVDKDGSGVRHCCASWLGRREPRFFTDVSSLEFGGLSTIAPPPHPPRPIWCVSTANMYSVSMLCRYKYDCLSLRSVRRWRLRCTSDDQCFEFGVSVHRPTPSVRYIISIYILYIFKQRNLVHLHTYLYIYLL